MENAHWQKNRGIVERIIIEGVLVLETPARFGNGDAEELVDMPLVVDPLEGRALLTGASLAGALRSYLRERQYGYRGTGGKDALYKTLFGLQEGDNGEQSLLITCDSLGSRPVKELRDGVAIDPCTRTAEDKKKYDMELLEAGTRFPLKVELLVREGKENDLRRGLAIALQGLERSEIPLGARKRRGFGWCRVEEWQLCRYDLTKSRGLIDWLSNEKNHIEKGQDIARMLGVRDANQDERTLFALEAVFGLDSSLLIRSGAGEADAPDMVHLRSNRHGQPVPILSGTSLAGALRARALRIANTLGAKDKAKAAVNELFGPRLESRNDKPEASRLVTTETAIAHPLDLVQSRVKIDRFTGGSYPTALFTEQPVFGCKGTNIAVKIVLQQPAPTQIGLLLLLLKDLWTGDLPLGGESSVGRGRLRGQSATLTYRQPGAKEVWTIIQADDKLQITGDKERLEKFIGEFGKEVQP